MKYQLTSLKTLRFLAAILVVGAGVTACKDYLDVSPKATPLAQSFYTTPEHAQLGVNGIYNMLRKNSFNDGLFPMLDIMSDDCRKGSNPGDALSNVGIPYDQFQHNATTENTVSWYGTLYQGVHRANAMIEYIPNIKMDEKLRSRLLGEAHFLRGLFYLDLARGFNNIPIVLKADPDGPTVVKQDSGRNVYDQIIKPDLLFARDNLPEAFTGSDLGRATKGAANGLLARAALYFKDYPVAATAAQDVINSGLYGLEADYRNAFYATGNFGRESVFEIGSIGQEDNNGQDMGGNGYGNVMGVRGTPNKGWGFNRPFIELLRAFEPGDMRKKKGIIYLGEVMNQGQSDEVVIVGDGNTPDFTLGKNPVTGQENDTLEYETYNEKVWTPSNNGAHNPPSAFGAHRRFIRYADVLLMAAEALYYINGDPNKIVEYVNLVRARARENQTGVLPDITTADNLLEKIKHERRVELFMEGHRFFDLVRWGETKKMEPFGFQYPKNKYLPLPQSEIDISGGHLKQNFGY